jgi:hypothetical protein
VSEITPGQAHYIVERLRKAGHLTAVHVRGYLADLAREIADIEHRLRHLRDVKAASNEATPGRRQVSDTDEGRSPSAQSEGRKPRAAGASRKKKRKFTVTPKVLASRELQGRYLPLLNKFTGRRRAEYARIAKERGREAAIAAMEAALRS